MTDPARALPPCSLCGEHVPLSGALHDGKAWQCLKHSAPCECRMCLDTEDAALPWLEKRTTFRMVVCATCGNKRCPRASNHDHACLPGDGD